MKCILQFILMMFFCLATLAQSTLSDTISLKDVQVSAVIAGNKVPVTKTNFSRAELQKKNIGQDLPFILQSTPGLVANSDAGNGVGYTGLRLRGTDASRINVTLNGIPYNDGESQGTFLVDIPDIVASASSIQIQRGVGTSSNGPGAFGGSIHIQTNEVVKEKKLQLNIAGGSFGTLRTSISNNTGLISKKWLIDTRASYIRSDGYIDRAKSSLKSFYNSVAYTGNKNSVRFNVLYGNERTYQAWNGVNDEQLKNDRTYNSTGTAQPGSPYKNEVDDYDQTHLQLFYDHIFTKYLKSNVTLYSTLGNGYYEQYRAAAALSDYGLPDFINGSDTINETDLVRRLWLRNTLTGALYSMQFTKNGTEIIAGGNLSRYEGNHFGKIINALVPGAIPKDYKWYDLDASKTEVSAYVKWTQTLAKSLFAFIDLQGRSVNYKIGGFRNNPTINVQSNFDFFNPKAGLKYNAKNIQAYISYGRAAKEPNRDDFETNTANKPKPEKLNNVELGFSTGNKRISISSNIYYMGYKNQLVLTGAVNDVGAYSRVNVPESYRTGVETEVKIGVSKKLSLTANLALSRNKLKGYTELIDNYDTGVQEQIFYSNPDIAFSPSVVGYGALLWQPVKQLELTFTGKYVSRQYLDNTNNDFRSLSPYYNQDIMARYTMPTRKPNRIFFYTQLTNIFSERYEPNGYTFSYIYGATTTTENYYFPMSGISIIGGVQINF